MYLHLECAEATFMQQAKSQCSRTAGNLQSRIKRKRFESAATRRPKLSQASTEY